MVAEEPQTSRPIPEAARRNTLTLAAGKTDGGASRASLQAVSDCQALGLSECGRSVAGVVARGTWGQWGRPAGDVLLERPT
jgi:hypothetical protein